MQQVNHVLLVDDDEIFNLINEKFIQKAKFSLNVKCYADAADALLYLKQLLLTDITLFPDVIFIDMNMPEMNVWTFLDELCLFPESVLSGCKLFALTSSVDEEDIEKSKNYKLMCDFISKPLTVEKLETLFCP